MNATLSIERFDRIGLLRPAVDAHTLGISSIRVLLKDCGVESVVGDLSVCLAVSDPLAERNADIIAGWIRDNRISVIGYSFRLDPEEGAALLGRFIHFLDSRTLWKEAGGPIRNLFFAGLPPTCALVRDRYPRVAGVFHGDENPLEALRMLGIPETRIPGSVAKDVLYDEARLAFGRELVKKGDYLEEKAVRGRDYPEFGTARDGVEARVSHGIRNRLPPLMRAHVGPYLPDRDAAVKLFLQWTRSLAASGFLDVLSIGSSQLSQSDFYGSWENRLNGGGVPIKSAEEFASVWAAARPMLVRTYAGTRDIPRLAKMYDETINAAWHTMSFWWFCRIDGRGDLGVLENLEQHLETLSYLAKVGKPFEPNIPHHFSFRGGDDVTYVVSAYLAAKIAKLRGIRTLILQVMLNTPKQTWGIADLAKARSLLALVRGLCDDKFQVFLQPRGGLDYFSSDEVLAKAQLASVTALMDDIEPFDSSSPQIIHVVSYSEGFRLADPPVVDESIKITRHALEKYRNLRARGLIDNMREHRETRFRTETILGEAKKLIAAIESAIPEPYSPRGLYRIFEAGFLPVPYLWEGRDEFPNAVNWTTALVQGSVRIVDAENTPISVEERIATVKNRLTEHPAPGQA